MKICEICNTKFECQGNYDCWCMDLPVVDIPIKLHDCVCLSCLEEMINDQNNKNL